jgi:pyruvate/2-oxoglutarate dehydrogenase complex dihydrolipoamide dehydrogenase (E3) component
MNPLFVLSPLAGVVLHFNVKILGVKGLSDTSDRVEISYSEPWGLYSVTVQSESLGTIDIQAEQILNATGRVPNVFGMGLEKVT